VSDILSALRSLWRDAYRQKLDSWLGMGRKSILEADNDPFLGISRLFAMPTIGSAFWLGVGDCGALV
jgi:hypothetical protein